MVEPSQEEMIDITGPKGKSLFYHALVDVAAGRDLVRMEKEIQRRIDRYTEKYEETRDERATVIVGALIIENELDELLSAWLKNYKNIKNKRDLNFSFKIDLAISSKLIPTRILNSIDPIRKIRNIFAHDLEVNDFAKARTVDDAPFKELHNKVKTFIKWDNEDDGQTFKQLVLLISLALNIYTKHVIKVKDYIWKPVNLSKIMKV